MEGGGGEIGGPSIFFLDGVWGALKCQKMTLGGVFKQHDAWVFKDLILIQFYTKSYSVKQFNQHFDKTI